MQHVIIFSNGSKFRLVSNFTVTLSYSSFPFLCAFDCNVSLTVPYVVLHTDTYVSALTLCVWWLVTLFDCVVFTLKIRTFVSMYLNFICHLLAGILAALSTVIYPLAMFCYG